MGSFPLIKILFLLPSVFFLALEYVTPQGNEASLGLREESDAGLHDSLSNRVVLQNGVHFGSKTVYSSSPNCSTSQGGNNCPTNDSNGQMTSPQPGDKAPPPKNLHSPPTSPPPSPPPTSAAPPAPPRPPPQPPGAAFPPAMSTKEKKKPLAHILASISSGLLILCFVFMLTFWHKRSKAVKPLDVDSNGQQHTSSISGVQLLKQTELESACEFFSNIVGSVSDGPLYKGTLSSGVEVTVSSIKLDKALRRPSEAQFRKKVALLSKVSHKNFVNLLGYCEEEPQTRMLVFEYAPNGTLFDHLHNGESVGLSWAARMRIAMGVAYCLDHVYQLDPPIILKNLDTKLIYLTDDFAAKIADFELWSGTAEGGTAVGSSMSLLQEVPDKGSMEQKFGIVLFELLSGRDPDSEQSGPVEIWAWDFLKQEKPLKDMMDPELKSFPEDRAAAVFQLIKQCLNPNTEQMLSIKEVVARLREITGISPKSAAPLGYDLEIVSEGAT